MVKSLHKRNFLFLQGVCSPFFGRLADRLKADGHNVYKVNFNCGDVVYWAPRTGFAFRGDLAALPEFLVSIWLKYGITDQILFGDRRPVHRMQDTRVRSLPSDQRPEHRRLKTRASDYGIRNHVFEEGYFRPHWVTLERGGVNRNSKLPRDPKWFLDVDKLLPEPITPQTFHSPFKHRVFHDVAYHVAGLGNPLIFPYYKTHAPVTAPIEYAGYINRFSKLRHWQQHDNALINQLLRKRQPFYVLPLQLNGDAQIRDHSCFKDMLEVLDVVVQSFTKFASSDTLLVIKNHPLDMGLVDYKQHIKNLAKRFDVAGRLMYLETGDLGALLSQAAGTVTVNSTVGSLSLASNCPTLALSDAIYNMPGLTFQDGLDNFWRQGTKPDEGLYRCFRNVVIQTTQINGGFYSQSGIDLAVHHASKVLPAEKSPLQQFL